MCFCPREQGRGCSGVSFWVLPRVALQMTQYILTGEALMSINKTFSIALTVLQCCHAKLFCCLAFCQNLVMLLCVLQTTDYRVHISWGHDGVLFKLHHYKPIVQRPLQCSSILIKQACVTTYHKLAKLFCMYPLMFSVLFWMLFSVFSDVTGR